MNEPLCVEIYMCQCWHKKHKLGTCVFAERLKSRCVQIYVQLYLKGIHPSPVFPKSTPALFSPGASQAIFYPFPSFNLALSAKITVGFWQELVLLIAVQRIEPKALCTLGKCLTTELRPGPLLRGFMGCSSLPLHICCCLVGTVGGNGCQGGNWQEWRKG